MNSVPSRVERPFRVLITHPSALLTDSEPHGDGLAAFGVISRLAARGHRVDVLAEAAAIAGETPKAVVIHEVGVRAALTAAERARLMYRIGRKARQLWRTEFFDIVHQLNPVDLALSALVPLHSAPLILGPYVPRWPPGSRPGDRARRALLDTLERPARWLEQRRASALLLSTPAAQSRRARMTGRRPPIYFLGPGIDTRRLSGPRQPLRMRRGRIIFVSSLEPRKGIFTLLAAFTRVLEAEPNATLVVAGEGSASAEVRAVVSRSTLAGHVELLGRVRRDELPALLARCEIFCQPSRGEPFGIAILEAMAAGLPVVATDRGGPPHLLARTPDELVAVDDDAALANRLIALLRNPARAACIGEVNREQVRRHHDLERIVDRLELIYRHAIETSSRRRNR